MQNFISDNKRIAKNTILLYARTIVVLLVMLYSTRVVLRALGIDDLGIFNVVAGIVSMMSFLQAALVKSTSRFITYELGLRSESAKIRRVFALSVTIHLLLALFVILLGETLGVYILNNWTAIPDSRSNAAVIVFQCSLLAFSAQIMRAPYDAVIVAHERMSFYAWVSILEAVLQLAISYLLLYAEIDKLMLYGILMFASSLILFFTYQVFVKLKFKVYQFRLMWDKKYSLAILSFSGWNLLGSSVNVATQQGVSLLFNNFVGLFANAALGFATQVNGAVCKFINNFSTAFNPQIIKLCAQEDSLRLHTLINRTSKFSFCLIWVMALPLIFNIDFVLHLWLGEVPRFTAEFCQLILACSIIDAVTGVYNTAITAYGKIKNYQIAISISFLIDLLCAVVILKFGLSPVCVFISRIITRGFVNMIIGLSFIKKQLDFNIGAYVKTVLLPIIATIMITFPIIHTITHYMHNWPSLLLSCLGSVISVGLCSYFIIMNSQERRSVMSSIRNLYEKRFVEI